MNARNQRLLLILSVLLALLLWRRARGDESHAAAGQIVWQKSFAAAREASVKGQKPLLVDFEAEWCVFCKKLDRETYTDDKVIRLVRESFLAVKVDVDVEPDLRKEYKVEGLPTILVLAPGGEELQRITGFRPPELFVQDLQKSAVSSAAFSSLKAAAEKDPRDAGAQCAYARALFAAGNAEGAVKALEAAEKALGADDKGRAAVLLDLGDVLRAAARDAQARAAYEKLLALKDDDAREAKARARTPLAAVLLKLADPEGAVRVLDAAMKDEGRRGRDLVEALYLRAYAHAVRKDADKALADLKAAREADPEGRWGQRAADILDLIEGK